MPTNSFRGNSGAISRRTLGTNRSAPLRRRLARRYCSICSPRTTFRTTTARSNFIRRITNYWPNGTGNGPPKRDNTQIALRSYLLTSRNADPRELEDDRLATMTSGYRTGLPNPIAIFAYTSAQELATRVSHRNAGKLTDDPVAYEIMSRIAVDENHHFMFYRGAVTAMLRENPSLVLPEIYRVLSNFEMPESACPSTCAGR